MDEEKNFLFEEGNIKDALDRFQNMLKSKEQLFFDVHELEEIIDYYTEQQNFKFADQAVKLASSQHPTALSLKLKEAQLLIEKGIPQKAIRILDEILLLEVTNSEIYFLKGVANVLLKNFVHAESLFAKSIEFAVEDRDEVLYQISINLIHLGYTEFAINYLLQAHELDEFNLLVIYELANCYENIHKYEQSAKFYLKYLDFDPFAESIWNALGVVFSENGQVEQANEAFDYAIAINPMYTSPYYNKANLYIDFNKYSEAIEIYEELLPLDIDNAQTYYLLGECYDKNNNLVSSLDYYKRAVRIDETFADAWYGVAMVNVKLEQHKEAIKYLKKALFHDEENPEYWYQLGICYDKTKRTDKALFAYNKVVEIDQFDTEAITGKINLLVSQKRFNEAIITLNKVKSYNNSSAIIHYLFSIVYKYKNQHKLALHYFEKGLSLEFSEHLIVLKEFPHLITNENYRNLIIKYSKQ